MQIPLSLRMRRLLWPGDMAALWFQNSVLRRNVPLLASFKLTYRCNLRCSACPYHSRGDGPDGNMTWQAALQSLERLRRSGCRIVMFEGGEPFIWRDQGHGIKDVIAAARSRFLRVGVTTNGTLPLDAPADLIWVSIDGLPATHNRLRSDSFEQIWHNIERAGRGTIMIHYTMNRENWRDLEPLLQKLRSVPAVRGVTLQLFYPYHQGEADLLLTVEERRAAIENAIALKKRGYPVFNSTAMLRAMISNSWRCRANLLVNVDPDGTLTSGCYVTSRGTIDCSQCGFTPVAEASAAFSLNPQSILAGWRIFFPNNRET